MEEEELEHEEAAFFDSHGNFLGESLSVDAFAASPHGTLKEALLSKNGVRIASGSDGDGDAVILDFDAFARLCDKLETYRDVMVSIAQIDRGDFIPGEQVHQEAASFLESLAKRRVNDNGNDTSLNRDMAIAI